MEDEAFMYRGQAGAKRPGYKLKEDIFGIILLLPAVTVLCIAVAMPILKGIYVSFCNYGLKNIDSPVWNSFANYKAIFKNGEVVKYFGTTLLFVICVVTIQFVIGMGAALLLNREIHGRGLFRGLLLIPWTIPSVVVAITFRWMFHPQFGVLNYIFFKLGLSDTVNVAWTQFPARSMALAVIAVVWRQLPYMTVMILSGLQSVDETLVESARIDGANERKVFRYIILPSIRPVTSTAVWIAVMNNFQMFTIVYNITGGGPGISTTTLGIAVYKTAFQSFDFGKASAMGVVWLAALFIMTLIKNRIGDSNTAEYQ